MQYLIKISLVRGNTDPTYTDTSLGLVNDELFLTDSNQNLSYDGDTYYNGRMSPGFAATKDADFRQGGTSEKYRECQFTILNLGLQTVLESEGLSLVNSFVTVVGVNGAERPIGFVGVVKNSDPNNQGFDLKCYSDFVEKQYNFPLGIATGEVGNVKAEGTYNVTIDTIKAYPSQAQENQQFYTFCSSFQTSVIGNQHTAVIYCEDFSVLGPQITGKYIECIFGEGKGEKSQIYGWGSGTGGSSVYGSNSAITLILSKPFIEVQPLDTNPNTGVISSIFRFTDDKVEGSFSEKEIASIGAFEYQNLINQTGNKYEITEYINAQNEEFLGKFNFEKYVEVLDSDIVGSASPLVLSNENNGDATLKFQAINPIPVTDLNDSWRLIDIKVPNGTSNIFKILEVSLDVELNTEVEYEALSKYDGSLFHYFSFTANNNTNNEINDFKFSSELDSAGNQYEQILFSDVVGSISSLFFRQGSEEEDGFKRTESGRQAYFCVEPAIAYTNIAFQNNSGYETNLAQSIDGFQEFQDRQRVILKIPFRVQNTTGSDVTYSIYLNNFFAGTQSAGEKISDIVFEIEGEKLSNLPSSSSDETPKYLSQHVRYFLEGYMSFSDFDSSLDATSSLGGLMAVYLTPNENNSIDLIDDMLKFSKYSLLRDASQNWFLKDMSDLYSSTAAVASFNSEDTVEDTFQVDQSGLDLVYNEFKNIQYGYDYSTESYLYSISFNTDPSTYSFATCVETNDDSISGDVDKLNLCESIWNALKASQGVYNTINPLPDDRREFKYHRTDYTDVLVTLYHWAVYDGFNKDLISFDIPERLYTTNTNIGDIIEYTNNWETNGITYRCMISGISNSDSGDISISCIVDSLDRPTSFIIDESGLATVIVDEGQDPYGIIDEA